MIASFAIALWGITVMSCFFVTTFLQLVLARVAAAIGEAGAMPPTYSLVGDYFPRPDARTRALTIYMLANPLSNLLSFAIGGWLTVRYGWRYTFFLMGLPAIVLAIIVRMTITDPRHQAGSLAAPTRLPVMREVLDALWRQRASRHLGIALILLYTMGLGMGPWFAAFLMRSHHLDTAELGVWLGVIFGVVGLVGILLGGYVAARWFSGDERGQVRLSAIAIALTAPCYAVFLFAPQKYLALGALVPIAVAFNFFLGPTIALLQRLAADEMRATGLAVVMLLANLIGMGIGPQIVGVLSDLMAPVLGADSLRYALLIMSCVAFWGALHLWKSGCTMPQDLASAEAL
jgi:MFS family permease